MVRALHKLAGGTAAIASLLLLASCGGGDTPTSPAPVSGNTQTSSSTPPNPLGNNLNVTRCLTQQAVPGRTVADLVVPDELKVDFSQPPGFPNGRLLSDPVVDLTLAALFLDLTKHPITALTALPLNPSANDLPFRSTFPYLAAAQGAHPASTATGTNYNFRTDPVSAYVRVDRMGMPAVATVLITSAHKSEYNDAGPIDDTNFKFLSVINEDLTGFANALSNDLKSAGFSLCATPN
jgi:hypothetical protein